MFDIEIINHAELMIDIGYTFEEIHIFLQREGYDLVEGVNYFDMNIPDREFITLSNGWIVYELI